METGEVIRFLRQRDGLSQQELADHLLVVRSSVQKMEAGKVLNFKLDTIQKLCKLFRVAPFAFVFPDAWRGSQMEYGGSPDFYKYTAKYSLLTDEGKRKILDYVDDISGNERYLREDAEGYEELHKLFLQIGDSENEYR